MASGGPRPNSGPKKGTHFNKTLEKRAEMETIRKFVSERLTGILEAMHNKAVGCAIIDKKDDTGERIFDLPPDEKAAKLLLEYAYGKPQQYVDITSGGEQVAMTAQDLVERIKNAKAGLK